MSVLDRRMCDMCRKEFARNSELNEFVGINKIDDIFDLCNECLAKIIKFIERRDSNEKG